MTLLLVYLSVALGVSFLCSLLEASLLSLPVSYIETIAQHGSRSGRWLVWMKDHIDRPLAAILTLNTVAHTFGAAGVGAEAAYLFGHAWVGLISVVVTILILLFSEIIPKTLGALHAKRLAGFTAYTVIVLIYATYPIVVVCQWLSRLVSLGRQSDEGQAVTRDEVLTMARIGSRAGAISIEEYDAMRNLLRLRRVPVKDVMTPRAVLFALPQDMTVAQAIDEHRPLRFARIPLYRENVDQMTGLVHRARLFEAYADGRGDLPLRDLATPLHAIPELATVSQALPQFIEQREQFFQVVDEYGGTAGALTLEDALETLLGREIIGETDPAPDMRRLAQRLAKRRQARRDA